MMSLLSYLNLILIANLTFQEWIVAVIVFICVILVVNRIIHFFRSAKNNENPCAGCVNGCDLKKMLDEKQQKCKEDLKKKNKKCCG